MLNLSAAEEHMERRRSPRISVPFHVSVRSGDENGSEYHAETVLDNLSAGGCYLRLPRKFACGSEIFTSSAFGGSGEEGRAPVIATKGVVARVEETGRRPVGNRRHFPAAPLHLRAMPKRLFDLACAHARHRRAVAIWVVVSALIKLSSPGPVLFRQERIAGTSAPSGSAKFRTMVKDAPSRGGLLTAGNDSRITTVGKFLPQDQDRRAPAALQHSRGEMSLVGPRPEVRKYVEMFPRTFVKYCA